MSRPRLALLTALAMASFAGNSLLCRVALRNTSFNRACRASGTFLRAAFCGRRFAVEQRRILTGLWPLLAPGGLLLYATCSVFAGENELRVREFMAQTPEALRETIRFDPDVVHVGGQLLPSGKGARHNHDGFFYALLRKA